MVLTLSLALISSQFREVPLTEFRRLADAPALAAIATSQDGHTVSVWTRWSESAPTCQGWRFDDEGKHVEGLGEVPCPGAAPRGKRHLFLDSKVLGDPKALVPVLDSYRNLVALVFPHPGRRVERERRLGRRVGARRPHPARRRGARARLAPVAPGRAGRRPPGLRRP
jgi:hypothetical protein